jgi:hypothetical protein
MFDFASHSQCFENEVSSFPDISEQKRISNEERFFPCKARGQNDMLNRHEVWVKRLLPELCLPRLKIILDTIDKWNMERMRV